MELGGEGYEPEGVGARVYDWSLLDVLDLRLSLRAVAVVL